MLFVVLCGQRYCVGVILIGDMKKILLLFFLYLKLSSVGLAQGGSNCANAMANPSTLPFNYTGESTCTSTNTYTGTNSCVGSLYYGAKNWYYYFCPTQAGYVDFDLIVTNGNTASYPSLTLFAGCPGTGQCLSTAYQLVAANQTATLSLTAFLNTNQCYYLVVDGFVINNSSIYANCINYNITANYLPAPPVQPGCTNLDFEAGNLSGWFGTTGSVATGCATCPTPTYNLSATGIVAGRHTIMTGGNDPCGGFPRVAPGGSFSCRLGDNLIGAKGEQLMQTFTVSAANSSLTYRYAVVLENPSYHTANEQPFFRALVRDQTGSIIQCSDFVVAAASNLPGFSNSNNCTGSIYKPWSTVNVDLSNYIGQNVTIEFTTGDCSQSGHFGYAYIDCSCAPSLLQSNSDTLCPGQCATLTAPAGYQTYAWSPGNSSATSITVCPAATTVYTLSLTAFNGCTTQYKDTIWVMANPVANFTVASPQCNVPIVINNTSTVAQPSTITSYNWSFPGAIPATSTAQTPGGIIYSAPGTYTITLQVTTQAGCTATTTQTITIPPCPFLVLVNSAPICTGACTNLTANVTSGNPPFSYSWSPVSGSTPTIQVCPTATTIYTITVTDGNGQTTSDTVKVIVVPPLQVNLTGTTISCKDTFATATATPLNGNAPYRYAWSNGDTTQTATGLSIGTASVTVTDVNGCTNTSSVVITANTTVPNVSIATPAQLTCIQTNTTLTGNSTTPNVTYQWSNGPTTASYLISTPDTYTLTVTDTSNGCTDSTTVVVSASVVLPNITIAPPAKLTCTNTSVTLNGSSTTSGVTYQWTNGPATANYTVTAQGTYALTVTDPSTGCTSTASVTVTKNTNLPNASIATPIQLTCALTSVSLIGNSTTSNATYQWTSGPATATYSVNAPGTYSLTVTNPVNGCTRTVSITVTANTNPPNISIATPPQLTCNTTSVTLNGNSTTAGSTYQWTSGPATKNYSVSIPGTYTFTVTDPSNGCTSTTNVLVLQDTISPDIFIAPPDQLTCAKTSVNLVGSSTTPGVTYQWALGGSTPTYTVGAADTYTLTVTNPGTGCAATTTINVLADTNKPNVSIVPPSPLSCTTTSVIIDGSSTTNGAIFFWSTSNGSISGSSSSDDVIAISTGTYALSVTDTSNGCVVFDDVTVTGLPPLTATATTTNIICRGDSTGSGSITIATGSPSYIWSFTPAISFQLDTSGTVALLDSLPAGTYNYVINDSVGCVLAQNFTLTEPAQGISLNLQAVDDYCADSRGSIAATSAGGVGSIAYSWQPVVSDSTTASNLSAGLYTVTATDTLGCNITQSITVNAPPPLDLTVTSSEQAICIGKSVQLSAIPNGGTPAYTIIWQPGSLQGPSQIQAPLSTTTYSAMVTDTNGCQYVDSIAVVVNPLPSTVFSGDTLQNCVPACVNFNSQSGTGLWYWDFGDGTSLNGNGSAFHCYNQAGVYDVQVVVVDPSTGCTDSLLLSNYITAHALPVANFTYSPSSSTILNPYVSFTDQSFAYSPAQLTSWNWSFGDFANSLSTQQNPGFTYPDTGCYQVVLTITDNNGCRSETADTVCIDPDATLFVPNAFTPNGDGKNEVFLPQGIGIEPDSYELWIFDRWGNMIFYSNDLNIGWDGRLGKSSIIAQIDTYVWKIRCKDVLGKQINKNGKVTLIR